MFPTYKMITSKSQPQLPQSQATPMKADMGKKTEQPSTSAASVAGLADAFEGSDIGTNCKTNS